MLKRLSQKFKGNVDVGCDREDEIARQLASLARDPAYTDLEQDIQEERQTLEATARSVDPEYFSLLDWSISKNPCFKPRKASQQDRFKELRNQYQKMLKQEKRQSFNAYLEETSESRDTKKFYDMLKRFCPKFEWNVNVTCNREDDIARQLASLASDPADTDLEQEIQEERQTLEARARSVDPEFFSVLDWSTS